MSWLPTHGSTYVTAARPRRPINLGSWVRCGQHMLSWRLGNYFEYLEHLGRARFAWFMLEARAWPISVKSKCPALTFSFYRGDGSHVTRSELSMTEHRSELYSAPGIHTTNQSYYIRSFWKSDFFMPSAQFCQSQCRGLPGKW